MNISTANRIKSRMNKKLKADPTTKAVVVTDRYDGKIDGYGVSLKIDTGDVSITKRVA